MTQAISDPRQASAALADLFDTHKRVVFFGGAGVSTASGIPDFRSVDGLYHQQFAYPPETMLSHSFYEAHPAEFFDFYRTKMIALGAKPNRCHTKLAELERAGKLNAVVTQNIDGLHQMAARSVCSSCTARSIATFASRAARSIAPSGFACASTRTPRACLCALRAAGALSPMWCSTRSRSMSMC